MKKTSAFLVVMSVALAGCAGWHRAPNYSTPPQSNVNAYDDYVRRRTSELAAGGKTSSEAGLIADNEARRLYGERTDGGSTQSANVSWTNDNSHPISLSDLDQTVAGMKQSKR